MFFGMSLCVMTAKTPGCFSALRGVDVEDAGAVVRRAQPLAGEHARTDQSATYCVRPVTCAIPS